ncbi:MAG: hypothetical protein Q7S83_04195 [bacterium]|nr:hypothetical protein [bacterium]
MITPERIHARERETRRMSIAPNPGCIGWGELRSWPDVSPEVRYHVGICAFCKNLVSPMVEEIQAKKRPSLLGRLAGFFRKIFSSNN